SRLLYQLDHRPTVSPLVPYTTLFRSYLAELADFAHRENIPIIQHEVVAYFRFLMQTLQPKNILEIGTAIGFSTLLMAENAPGAKITTLDRNPEMIAFAKDNFAKYDKIGRAHV